MTNTDTDTNTGTGTMRAAVTLDDGTQEVQQVPQPPMLANEVMIKVAAIGINPVDWKTAEGLGSRNNFSGDGPVIVGWDVAGTVVAAGPGTTRFVVGDRVFGMPRFPRPANGYAEYVVSGSRQVAKIPDGVSDLEAGAAPLAALTAWQALVDTIGVGEGDRVIIHAGSGGVGHLAIQIAKAFGAEVWTTASESKHDRLRELGADHCINHRTTLFEEVAEGMDAVLDLYGGDTYPTRSVKTLRPGGKLVLIPRPDQIPAQHVLDAAEVTASWMLVEPDHNALEQIAELMASGALRVIVSETRPLELIGELHEIGRAGSPFGKLAATIS